MQAAPELTLRALMTDGQSVHLERTYAAPIATEDYAVIQLACALVSPIDVQLAKGLLNYRGTLGHQFVGVVQAVSKSATVVERALIGKRVVGGIAAACGQCDMCLSGLGRHCRKQGLLFSKDGNSGCFADQFLWPTKSLAIVPDGVSDAEAVFAIEVASALQSAAHLTIVNRPYITVLGDNTLGLLTAQVMSKLNATVRWLGNQQACILACEKWGLKHRAIDEVGRRADQDIVVDCSATASGFALATSLVRPRGKVMLKCFGSQQMMAGFDMNPVVEKELELMGSHSGSVDEAMVKLTQREVDVSGLLTKRMSLSARQNILKAAGQPGVMGVLLEP